MPYFGKWPAWFDLFLLSCKWNASIDWLFLTDCPEPALRMPNVRYRQIEFSDYCKLVSSRLGIDFKPRTPYKLCDVKPCYGYIHSDAIEGYDFFGFGDVDVIYGDLRKFLDERVLSHQLISTHRGRISGHFCLLKNNEKMRNAFRRIVGWQGLLETPEHLGIDESNFTKVFLRLRHRLYPTLVRELPGVFDGFQRNNHWEEQYSTILSPLPWIDGSAQHPEEWLWKDGHLTNTRDGDREFMYLHFMNWKSARWLPKELRRSGGRAAWEDNEKVSYVGHRDVPNGFRISRQGFHPL